MNKLFVGNKIIQDYSKNGESNLTHNYVINQHQQKVINTCTLFNMNKQQTPQDTNNKKPIPITDGNCKRGSLAPTNNVIINKKSITPPANTTTNNNKTAKNLI